MFILTCYILCRFPNIGVIVSREPGVIVVSDLVQGTVHMLTANHCFLPYNHEASAYIHTTPILPPIVI